MPTGSLFSLPPPQSGTGCARTQGNRGHYPRAPPCGHFVPCTQCPPQSGVTYKKARRLLERVTVDYRELSEVVPPIHAAVPNIVAKLDTLLQSQGYVTPYWTWPVLALAHSWLLSLKINLPLPGRDNDRPSRCSPKVTYIVSLYVMAWWLVTIFFSDSCKMGPLH